MEKIILEIDRDIIEPFYDSFSQVKSDIFIDLKNKNPIYSKLLDEKEIILDKYPNLRDVIENDNAMQLSEEEIKGLIELHNLWFDTKAMEDHAIYLKGIESGYLIFKKIGLIKSEK